MSRIWKRIAWEAFAVIACSIAAYEIIGLDPRYPSWHTISFESYAHSWLAWTVGVLVAALAIVFEIWWAHHARSPHEKLRGGPMPPKDRTPAAGRMLGRRPPKQAPSLHLGALLTGVVPAHPAAADHFLKVSDWGLYGNDRYSDCGPVSVANQRKLITTYLSAAEVSPSQDDVFDLYRRSGNPAFDPADPGGPGDGGVDMQTMLEALVAGGIGGIKPLAFAKVDQNNLDEIRAAIAIFGSVLYGVTLDETQRAQQLWDYSPSNVWGGHAVLAGRYSSSPTGEDVAVITWGHAMGTTDAFAAHQIEEVWAVIWPEHLSSATFLDGLDLAALAADYQALTGRVFPISTVPPSPAPTKPVLGGCAVGLLSLPFTRLVGGSS